MPLSREKNNGRLSSSRTHRFRAAHGALAWGYRRFHSAISLTCVCIGGRSFIISRPGPPQLKSNPLPSCSPFDCLIASSNAVAARTVCRNGSPKQGRYRDPLLERNYRSFRSLGFDSIRTRYGRYCACAVRPPCRLRQLWCRQHSPLIKRLV